MERGHQRRPGQQRGQPLGQLAGRPPGEGQRQALARPAPRARRPGTRCASSASGSCRCPGRRRPAAARPPRPPPAAPGPARPAPTLGAAAGRRPAATGSGAANSPSAAPRPAPPTVSARQRDPPCRRRPTGLQPRRARVVGRRDGTAGSAPPRGRPGPAGWSGRSKSALGPARAQVGQLLGLEQPHHAVLAVVPAGQHDLPRAAAGAAPRRCPAARPSPARPAARRCRIDSSGPNRSTSRPTAASTDFDFGPTPSSSPTTCGSCTRQRHPGAPAGAYPGARSASASTRCSTPTVTGLPQTGQRPSRARVSAGSSRTSQVRCPSRWYLPSSGKNSIVPSSPTPVSSAAAHPLVRQVAGQHRRLPAQRRRRVRVGVGDQPVAVQRGDPVVHRRVGGQPGLDREDVPGQVGVAVGDRVEAGLRAERREPGRPDVRRHQVAALAGVQQRLQQVAGVQPEDRPAVGGDVADPGQPPGQLGGHARGRARRAGGAPCGSSRPACRSWRSPPTAGTAPAPVRTPAAWPARPAPGPAAAGTARARPAPASSRISSAQAGWHRSPVPTRPIPLRAAHQARCSRSQSRLQARE